MAIGAMMRIRSTKKPKQMVPVVMRYLRIGFDCIIKAFGDEGKKA
jgi:hypothetical protein